jgi:hypothetical protein
MGQTHLSGTVVSLVSGDPGVPMSQRCWGPKRPSGKHWVCDVTWSRPLPLDHTIPVMPRAPCRAGPSPVNATVGFPCLRTPHCHRGHPSHIYALASKGNDPSAAHKTEPSSPHSCTHTTVARHFCSPWWPPPSSPILFELPRPLARFHRRPPRWSTSSSGRRRTTLSSTLTDAAPTPTSATNRALVSPLPPFASSDRLRPPPAARPLGPNCKTHFISRVLIIKFGTSL